MIIGFDHVVIAVHDLEAGAAQYETLLGRLVVDRHSHDGIDVARISLDNIAVELIAPGDGPSADRVRAALEDGEGLKSLVFAARDLPSLHRRAERVDLAPEAIAERGAYSVFRFAMQRTHGLRLMALARETPSENSPGSTHGVLGLDHIVVRTPDAERAAALYGARLGLDMRLDREVANRRLMFFRCGDAIVEVLHDPAIDNGRDCFWGLSWRVANADETRARLAHAGLDVCDVRTGLKPGTRVFTVRNGTCGVPTLMIEPSTKPD
ncbi:VOC family protein [Vitreimonas flagellata]|uniref:VOC family protein n=1 Tax=Vitreimonas flagellata TaxID=2560861 RepID=UPI001074B855|nr:VOC family protein [Vitreimonas flagellata]